MKKIILTLFPFFVIFIFVFSLSASTAKYIIEQSTDFNVIIYNLKDDTTTDLVNIYDDAVFEVPKDEVSADNINAINNGNTNYDGYDTSKRWTNWSSDWQTRTNAKTASPVFVWGDPFSISTVNVYYFFDYAATRVPSSVTLEYQNINGEWITISNVTETKNYTLSGTQVSTINGTSWSGYYNSVSAMSSFAINQTITDAVALKVIMYAQTYNTNYNYCLGLIEVEIIP